MAGLTEFSSDIDQLLAGGMGPLLHWFPEDVSISRLAVVMVGMANSGGGTILLGVAPRSGVVQGIRYPEEVRDRVFQAALLSEPPLILPVPRLCDSRQGKVMCFLIPAGLPHVYSLQGSYMGREGTQTNPLPARRLRQLLMERGIVQFETQVHPAANLSDLDVDQVEHYLHLINLPAEQIAGWQDALLRRGCLRLVGEQYQVTYAALLLFGRYPQQWLPSATILAARFSGVAFGDRFLKLEISGTLPDQLRQAETFVHANLNRVIRVEGLAHRETYEYPVDAVRELIVNAVAHRDYNQTGDCIHLNLFADRMEVQSPGSLPGPVTLDNLLQARFSRNAVIVQVLSDMGYIERLGYGLDRVVKLVHQQGLPPPRFEEITGTFRVTVWGEGLDQPKLADLSRYAGMNLNPRQELALGFLARRQRITNRDFQDLCPDVHSETLRRDLADLVERGVLIKIGDKKTTYYILK